MTLEAFVEALDRFLEADAGAHKLRVTARMEHRLHTAIARAFRLQGALFLRRLRARPSAQRSARNALREALPEDELERAWAAAFDEAVISTIVAMERPIRQWGGLALVEGARTAIAELGVTSSFDLGDPRAAAWLEVHAAERVAAINEATRRQIARIVTDGIAAGQSYAEIARTIRARYAEFAVMSPLAHVRSRAELVAITEIGDAYEQGNRFVINDLVALGLTMEKSWLTVGDDRVDGLCADNAAAGWIAEDATFPSGDGQPTAHPGCRCTTLYRRQGSAVCSVRNR